MRQRQHYGLRLVRAAIAALEQFARWLEPGGEDAAGAEDFGTGPPAPVCEVKPLSRPKREVVLKLIEQLRNDERAYMDLRFKHFTTFVVITGLMGSILFRVPEVHRLRAALAVFSLMMTILFWLLDFRTGQHQRVQSCKAAAYERFLRVPPVQVAKARGWVRASAVTNLIFATILLFWLIVVVGVLRGVISP